MYVPRPHPFINYEHLIYYGNFTLSINRIISFNCVGRLLDNSNKTDLFEKLDYFLMHENRRELSKIAARGYFHGLKYHRAASLTDYIFKVRYLYRND